MFSYTPQEKRQGRKTPAGTTREPTPPTRRPTRVYKFNFLKKFFIQFYIRFFFPVENSPTAEGWGACRPVTGIPVTEPAITGIPVIGLSVELRCLAAQCLQAI